MCEYFLQIRGIVYPKWTRKLTSNDSNQVDVRDDNANEEDSPKVKTKNKKPKYTWCIEKYVYSFSKHIENPASIRVKIKNEKDNYSNHVQNCPYRITKVMSKPFRLFPPFNSDNKGEH